MGVAGAATAREIMDLEDGLQRALMSTDLAWLARTFAPDAVYVHTSGRVESREQFIERLRSRGLSYRTRQIGELVIRRYGDAAVVTGWSGASVVLDGTDERQLDTRFTRVYVKEQGRWLLASSHSGANTANARKA